jgi:hypothetical protein
MLITTIIGLILNAVIFFEYGFLPEMIAIQLFFTGIGSWGFITGHELPDC